jgi:hypothetical protein
MRTAVRVIAVVALCAAMSLAQSQTLPDADEMRALATDLDRHDKSGDCKFIDDFVDRNVRNSDAKGLVARMVAFGSLTRRKPLAADSKVRCLYHDRGLAARVAIEQYEAQASAAVLPPVGFRAAPYLESALGSSWREKLAEAGVRAAAQDVAALHLLCVMKGTDDPGAFWAWMAEGSKDSERQDLRQELSLLADVFPCPHMATPASLPTACYWILFEDRWAPRSGPIVASVEMRRLPSVLIRLTRANKRVMALMEEAAKRNTTLQDPAANALFHAEIHRMLADGCAAVLPAATFASLKARAAKGPTRTIESLIAQVR